MQPFGLVPARAVLAGGRWRLRLPCRACTATMMGMDVAPALIRAPAIPAQVLHSGRGAIRRIFFFASSSTERAGVWATASLRCCFCFRETSQTTTLSDCERILVERLVVRTDSEFSEYSALTRWRIRCFACIVWFVACVRQRHRVPFYSILILSPRTTLNITVTYTVPQLPLPLLRRYLLVCRCCRDVGRFPPGKTSTTVHGARRQQTSAAAPVLPGLALLLCL